MNPSSSGWAVARRLSHWSLGQRLFGIFAFVLALASAQSFYGLFELRRMNQQTNAMQQHWLPAISHAGDMNTHLSNYRIAQLQHVIAATEEAKQGFEEAMKSVLEQLKESDQAFKANIATDDQRKLYAAFGELWAKYQSLNARLFQLSKDKQTAEAQALLNGEMRVAFEQASATLVTLVQINKFGGHLANEASDRIYLDASRWIIGAGALMMVATCTLAWRFARSLLGRVRAARLALVDMAEGRLDADVAAAGSDEVDQMLQALQRLAAQLRDIVGGVRTSAQAVAGASSQILNDSQVLADRTERQAAAVQQMAAAMRQVGSTVQSNSEQARQVSALAESASAVAQDGGQVFGEVVQTMKGIHDSARRIADIIAVIDGIAFQTNILALNAAVEAARAGEQGRGFAVVAGEVRSLAQRTAEAAREVKNLIGASVERVEHGNSLVDRASVTISGVVQSINRVTQMVAEISAATHEQSSGVRQVVEAVGHIDRGVSEDATLVASGQHAAQGLQAQATQLLDSMAFFELRAASPVPA